MNHFIFHTSDVMVFVNKVFDLLIFNCFKVYNLFLNRLYFNSIVSKIFLCLCKVLWIVCLWTYLLQDLGVLAVLALVLFDQALRGLGDGLVWEPDQWVELRGERGERHIDKHTVLTINLIFFVHFNFYAICYHLSLSILCLISIDPP